jgi:hypothetical protein
MATDIAPETWRNLTIWSKQTIQLTLLAHFQKQEMGLNRIFTDLANLSFFSLDHPTMTLNFLICNSTCWPKNVSLKRYTEEASSKTYR